MRHIELFKQGLITPWLLTVTQFYIRRISILHNHPTKHHKTSQKQTAVWTKPKQKPTSKPYLPLTILKFIVFYENNFYKNWSIRSIEWTSGLTRSICLCCIFAFILALKLINFHKNLVLFCSRNLHCCLVLSFTRSHPRNP